MKPQRPPRRAVHGVLLLDKPAGESSNHALQQAKRLYRAEKAGHTGTLDPLASGLLPIAFGAATKFAQLGLESDKRYRATLHLGVTTATGDGEGEVVRERPVGADRQAIDAACARFTGPIEQVPPMHSALKHEGRALYAYARRGIELERAPRRVAIHRLEVVQWQPPLLVLDIACSKGTYVRTLAEDLGEALGCGAHLAALRRTGSGLLDVSRALTPAALGSMSEPERDLCLLPAEALLAGHPEVRLEAGDAARFLTGLRRRIDATDAALVRVYGPGPHAPPEAAAARPAPAGGGSAAVFLGSARIAGGELIADRLLSPVEVQQLARAGTARHSAPTELRS